MRTRLWLAILLLLIIGILAPLFTFNLDTYPEPWFDEGVHLMVAKNYAEEGKYRFGPAVGPTVIIPVALALKIFGMSLLSARWLMVVYLSLCVLIFFALASYLGGWEVGVLATSFLVVSPGINLIYLGRQVMGEVPAVFFFLLGVLLWIRGIDNGSIKNRNLLLTAAGLSFGLAVLTKNQFALFFPVWILLWVSDKVFYHKLKSRDFYIPLIFLVCVVLLWYGGQRFFLQTGDRLAAQNIYEWKAALNRGFLVINRSRMEAAIKFLVGPDSFFAWVIPSLVYAVLLSLERSLKGVRWAFLSLVVLIWLIWFIFFSVAWPRYAVLPLTISAIFIAKFFNDLLGGLSSAIRELWTALRSRSWRAGNSINVVILAFLAIILIRPFYGRVTEVIGPADQSSVGMAKYIQENLPPDAVIETYEPEVCFLSGHPCHLPPSKIMNAAIRYVWYNAAPLSEQYDFLELAPPFLLIGEFGHWVDIYDEDTVHKFYVLEISIGDYDLYKAK